MESKRAGIKSDMLGGSVSKRVTLVKVSTLALAMMPWFLKPATAQNINCPQRIVVGDHVACTNGTLTIDPDGSTSSVGCLLTNQVPLPGVCHITSTGVLTRSVEVSFTTSFITMTAPGGTVTLDTFRMQERGQPTTAAQLTFTPTEVANTVTIDIGGTLHFTKGQAVGNYSGTLNVRAVLN